MIALSLDSTKSFMKEFLVGTLFDPFLMAEGLLITGITYNFDGHLNKDFYSEEEREGLPYEYETWEDFKKTVYELVKGNHTPLFMKFMLVLKPEKAEEMLKKAAPEDDFSALGGLLLSVKYEAGGVTLTTGTSYKTFVLSHEADKLWDSGIQKYLAAKGVGFEIM